uniref:TrmE-type G domain-containing protein n=1 Tax=Panagrellus redivivus TaxID=6233 RepID=A0A7E4VLM5_PANRE
MPCGVAVVRISGPKSAEALRKLTRQDSLQFIPRKLFYAKLYNVSASDLAHPKDDEVLDKAMAVFLPGPRTFTGEDTTELFLHGSRAVVDAVCGELGKIEGLEAAKAGEFTKRAFYNAKYDLAQVEALNDLLHSETQAQRQLALRQHDAGKYIKPVRETVLNLMAQLEASIDFPEDVDGQMTVSDEYYQSVETVLKYVKQFYRSAQKGTLIRDGVNVVLVGETNVGKSSLMNRLAEKDVAMTSNIPGTTRDFLETRLHLANVPVIVTDTAGIRITEDVLEKEGIRRSLERAKDAQIVVIVIDASRFEATRIEAFVDSLDIDFEKQTVVFCLNKADIIESETQKADISKAIKNYFPTIPIVWTSCLSPDGLSALSEAVSSKVAELCTPEGNDVYLSRQRHADLLQTAIIEVELHLNHLNDDRALACEHLRCAADAIGEISCNIVNEQVLDRLFSTFCIGK